MIIDAIRSRDWAAALAAYGAGQGDEVESDYALTHLRERYGDQVYKRADIMWRSIWFKSVDEWDDSLLDGVPDEVLHRFACACAIRALVAEEEAGKTVDPRSWDAIGAELAWLHGLASDEELAAASAAARAAAESASRTAAWVAVRSAPWEDHEPATTRAAWVASMAASLAAVRSADAPGGSADWDAAKDAERHWQIQTLADLCRRWALKVRSNK